MMISAKLSSLLRACQPHRSTADLACSDARRWLPGYLDGALPEDDRLHHRVASHLDLCQSCRRELQNYRALSRALLAVRPFEPPDDLPLSIRVAVSRARDTGSFRGWLNRSKTRWELLVAHFLQPLAIPATGGALVALIVFGFVFPNLGADLRLLTARPDLPLNISQPARLQTLAGFPLPGFEDASGASASQGVLVEATVNAQGQAVDYRIIGNPLNAGEQHQLDRVLLFSRFRPQMNFGKPASGGRVILGFSSVLVRG